MQRLLSTAEWDADAVRDDLVAYVREHLADPGAILILDKTSFLKKGTKSAGGQRQHTGTAGKRENCQIGVFVTYATPQAHVLVDRGLYLPQSWTSDPARCQEAGIPAERGIAAKPEVARMMLEHLRLHAAGLPAAWVTGDTVYGGSGPFRAWLEERRQPYVLAVAANDGLDLPYGDATMHALPEEIAQYALDPTDWRRRSAGEGAKGPRLYDWAQMPLAAPRASGFAQALLIRRIEGAPDDLEHLAYYLTFAPVGRPLRRWWRWRATAGTSRRTSRTPKERWAWTITRCAIGSACLASPAAARVHPALVGLASATSTTGQAQSLPTPHHTIAAVGIGSMYEDAVCSAACPITPFQPAGMSVSGMCFRVRAV